MVVRNINRFISGVVAFYINIVYRAVDAIAVASVVRIKFACEVGQSDSNDRASRFSASGALERKGVERELREFAIVSLVYYVASVNGGSFKFGFVVSRCAVFVVGGVIVFKAF